MGAKERFLKEILCVLRVTSKAEEITVHPPLIPRDDLSEGKLSFGLSLCRAHCHRFIQTPEPDTCEKRGGSKYLTRNGICAIVCRQNLLITVHTAVRPGNIYFLELIVAL